MSQRLHDHLSVIITECNLLEDTFGARSDVMTRVNIIRNAANRVANAIEVESWTVLEMATGSQSDTRVREGSS